MCVVKNIIIIIIFKNNKIKHQRLVELSNTNYLCKYLLPINLNTFIWCEFVMQSAGYLPI